MELLLLASLFSTHEWLFSFDDAQGTSLNNFQSHR